MKEDVEVPNKKRLRDRHKLCRIKRETKYLMQELPQIFDGNVNEISQTRKSILAYISKATVLFINF